MKGRGAFIVLEGLDGAGTTTQLERLSSVLRGEGHRVFATREPSDGPIGTQIRQALTGRLVLPQGAGPLTAETLALLFAADRMDHLAAQVEPALARGELVLCDRYVLSSLAYQGSTLPMQWVGELNARALAPDLTLFIDVNAATAASRRLVRGGAEELFEADAKQRKIRRQYQKALGSALVPGRSKIVRIDGKGSVEAVTEACLSALRPLLARRSRK